jgi:hypothetical protein
MWCNVVHNDRMNTKPLHPQSDTSSKPIRLTISVDPSTHAIFQRLAKVGNMSIGRAMGEWLADTVDAAELMASTMERARAAPKIVTAELHAMMLGMADQTKELADKYRKFKGPMESGAGDDVGGKRSATASAPAPDALIPPSCNTGGKVQDKQVKATGGKSVFLLPPASVQAYADTNGVPPKGQK